MIYLLSLISLVILIFKFPGIALWALGVYVGLFILFNLALLLKL